MEGELRGALDARMPPNVHQPTSAGPQQEQPGHAVARNRDRHDRERRHANRDHITAQRPSETVTRRLGQLANALERPRFQTTSLALDLRDQIRTLTATPTALPGNGS